MNSSRPLILFIGHNAGRGGAPVLLLELIREFSRQSEMPFAVLLNKGGPLEEQYKAAGDTYIWQPEFGSANNVFVNRLTRQWIVGIIQAWRQFRIRRALRGCSVIFANTIANGGLLSELGLSKSPVITYVHELEAAIREATNAESLQTVLNRTKHFLSGSRAVKHNLVHQRHVSEDKIDVLYSSLPVLTRNREVYADQTAKLRRQNNISSNALIVGVAGGSEWRKGIDFFLPLINLYKQMFPNNEVHFFWLGVKKDTPTFNNLMYDFEKTALKNMAHFLEHGMDYLPVMAAFDIHLLLSREDPYPLVMLDAATFGIPTVCFADAGGAPEFVEEDSGFAVPYGDLYALSVKLNLLVNDKNLLMKMGLRAQAKVRERHSQALAMEKIIDHLKKLM
jgi:glycosyltransferase involved in cell wall biosynthesis